MYMSNNLGDLGKTSPTKAAAKLVKLATKEAKHDAKINAKLAKYSAAGKTAKVDKVLAKEAIHDANLSAKVSKYQAIAAPAASPTSAPTVPAITTPPLPVSAPPSTVSPMDAVAPPVPTLAPPPASESYAYPLTQAPSLFTPAPSATPDSTAPVAADAGSSNMPLILGAAGLGLAALFFLGKKKRG